MDWPPATTTVLNSMMILLKELVEENESLENIYKRVKRRIIQYNHRFDDPLFEGNASLDCVLPENSRTIDSRRRTTTALLTMLMDHTSDIPKITKHLRDLMNNWEYKHAENSDAEEQKQPKRKMGATNDGEHQQYGTERSLHEKQLCGLTCPQLCEIGSSSSIDSLASIRY